MRQGAERGFRVLLWLSIIIVLWGHTSVQSFAVEEAEPIICPAYVESETGYGGIIRLAVEPRQWVKIETVYSIGGFLWESVPLEQDYANNSWQFWNTREITYPPETPFYYWFILEDADAHKFYSLDWRLPWKIESESETVDEDADGLPDAWEDYWWSSMEANGVDNSDQDTVYGIALVNRYEWLLGLSPVVSDENEHIPFLWRPMEPIPGDCVCLFVYPDMENTLMEGVLYAAVASEPEGGMDLQMVPLYYDVVAGCYTGQVTPNDKVTSLVITLVNEYGLIDDNCHLGWRIPISPEDMSLTQHQDGMASVSGEQSRLLQGGIVRAPNPYPSGIIYVDAELGSADHDGKSPVIQEGHGPKVRIDGGIECLRQTGGRVIITAGRYTEQCLPRSQHIRLEPEGHVVVSCRGPVAY